MILQTPLHIGSKDPTHGLEPVYKTPATVPECLIPQWGVWNPHNTKAKSSLSSTPTQRLTELRDPKIRLVLSKAFLHHERNEAWSSRQSECLAHTRPWPSALMLPAVKHVGACLSSGTWEVKAGWLRVQGLPKPHGEFEASLGCI